MPGPRGTVRHCENAEAHSDHTEGHRALARRGLQLYREVKADNTIEPNEDRLLEDVFLQIINGADEIDEEADQLVTESSQIDGVVSWAGQVLHAGWVSPKVERTTRDRIKDQNYLLELEAA
jgi:hypothetical protein